MKLKISCALFCMLVTHHAFAKAGEKQDYKCYLATTSSYQIAFYHWQVAKKQLNMAKLPGKKLPERHDGNRAYIKEVIECVELEESFSNGEAQKLDSQTLR